MTAPQLAPGSVVAQKYQVGACLGYAGSSATYQAVGGDGREVVLKMFDPGIRQRADIMAALEQTYAATNALPQDVAVPLLDAGYDAATGAPFSVSERIPFPSLAQLAAQRAPTAHAALTALTAEETSNVLGMMAQVLDRAHGNQLFHHALKPTNVFIGFAQGYGIRVTDFGAGLVRTAVPTQEGYALAAPWLAPEQVQGQSPAGAAADVFSAGLLAFFALTGRSYWRSCQSSTALDLAGWQHELMSPRTPPSARALQLGVQLNSAFDGVLGCALSPDPGQRYRTVGEFAQAMEAIAASKPPESQATMAFPAGALGLGGGGDYPPPPPPMGGAPAGGPRVPSSAVMMTQVSPGAGPMAQPEPMMGGQQQMPQQQMPQQQMSQQQMPQQQQMQSLQAQAGGNGAYMSMQTPPPTGLGDTAAGRPVDAAVFQRRPPSNRLAPILVGLVAVFLLGGAGAAWVLIGRKSHVDPATSASGSASAVPADTVPAPTATATAAPVDTAAAAPTETASAAPVESASAAPSGDANPGPAPLESTLSCDPECDEIKVDDKPIELGKPIVLPPGRHSVVASKAGYATYKDILNVKAGDKVEKTFRLKEKVAAPSGPVSGPGPKKPCFVKSKCK